MKSGRKSIILLFIIGILNLCACNQEIHKPITMVRAEKIMDENPDSARRLLAGLKADIVKENKATQMYYNLLTVKANDKCFIPHTSDSLMLELVKYYKHHGEPQQLIQAYYYLASVYRDLNFTAQALENFNKALNLPDKNCNLYKAKTANQIGQIYMYQNMYKEAMPYFDKTYQYAKLAPDTTFMVYALCDKGRSFQSQNNTQKAINVLEKAVSLSEQSHNKSTQFYALYELSISLLNNKDYQKALQVLDKCGKFQVEDDNASKLITKGLIFQKINQTDSAIHCYMQILNYKRINSKHGATLHLYEIYYNKGEYKKACKFLYDCLYYTDSLKTQNLENNANLIQELNKKIRIEREYNKLKISHLNLYLLLMGIILIFSLFFFILYTKNKKKIQLLKLRKEKLEQIHQQLYQESENYKRAISKLNNEIEKAKKDNNTSHEEILNLRKQSLELSRLQVENAQKESIAAINSFKNSDLYIKILNFIHKNKNITLELRKEIIEYTNLQNACFAKRLRELLPEIKDKELIVCCLIRLSFSNAEISRILSTSPQGISNLRKRLYLKMFKIEGNGDDLDKFLLGF